MSKILFVSKGLLRRTGGAETAAYNILSGILKHQNLSSIIILTNEPNSSKHLIHSFTLHSEIKIKIYAIPLVKPRISIFTDYLDSKRFKIWIEKIIPTEKIGLIHIHTYSTFYITPNSSWRVPVLYTFHDFPIKWPKTPYNSFPFNYIEKLWTKIAQRYWKEILSRKIRDKSGTDLLYFHCNGSDSQEYLVEKGIDKKHLILLPNGIEKRQIRHKTKENAIQAKLRELIDPKNRKLKILSVGQFNNIKNQFTLMKGFLQFSRDDPDSILLLTGNPTPFIGSFYMKKIWSTLNISKKRNIIWFGFVPNIVLTELYKIADLVILMSFSEASPLILGECVIMDKVMLSTNVGALRYILPKELSSLKPSSSDLLAKTITKINKNRDLLKYYASLMHEVKIPSWREVGIKLGTFYEFILERHQSTMLE